jgi:hypothetical protein
MAPHKIKHGLVGQYGRLWTRAPENLKKLAGKELKDVVGVYALYNGTMPVYIGRGNISKQIHQHNRNPKKNQFWEHFSWYEILGEGLDREIESLLLRILPFYVRSLNRKGGDSFVSRNKVIAPSTDPISDRWPEGGAGKKRHRKLS